MNNPIIYPYDSYLEWNDSTTVSLYGTVDASSIAVSAVENGVPATAYYNATSHEWSYDTTVTGYTTDFVIISEDALGNTASANAFIEVAPPEIINTLTTYKQLNPSLEGRTNIVASSLEASPDGVDYSPSGFVHTPNTTGFVYNNFVFNSPTQTYYFRGVDEDGGVSDPKLVTLQYLMQDPKIITELSDPYDSRTVSIAGSADHDIAEFVFSPVGGQFTSGQVEDASGGYTTWLYKFVMMQQSEEFSLKTVDAFGNESNEQTVQINYGVEAPLILLPGHIKAITDDVSITGSTTTNFVTLDGDFKNDGIIISDVVLALNGKNVGEYRTVNQVEDSYLVTDAFPYAWEEGDRIKIFPREDRPTLTSGEDTISLAGKANSNIAKVRYTTEELGPVKVSAKNVQNYIFNTSTNNLLLNVNGKTEFIILPTGELTAQEVADAVNAAFSTTHSYDVAFADDERFYIQALHIEVFDGTANSVLGLAVGEVNFMLELEVPDVLTFSNSSAGGADCSDDIIESSLLFCTNIDGVYVRFTFDTNTEYTKDEIIDKINTLAGKEVATNIGPYLVISAATNIWVGDPLSDLNLVEQQNGDANFNNDLNLSVDISRDPGSIESGYQGDGASGIGDSGLGAGGYSGAEGAGAGDWNINLGIIQPSNSYKIYGLSEFYEQSEPVTLQVEYAIDAPTINPYDSEVTVDTVDLSGTYTPSANDVTINGESVDLAQSGQWVSQVSLSEGNNTLEIAAVDRFGTVSASQAISITYTNPNNGAFPSSSDSIPLEWKSVSSPSLAPDDVQKVADTIDSIFDPVISVLDFVSGLLDIAKAFIVDTALGPVQALRTAVQALVDNVTELLDNLVNGAGLYTLSTLPSPADMKAGLNLGMFDHIKGSFPDFFVKVNSSFDDTLDSNRPQLSSNATVGGIVLAIGDGAGVADFLKAYKSLTQLYSKQTFDYGLPPVTNLKAVGQNQRVVLTWTAPEPEANIFPTDYIVYRSKTSGGEKPVAKFKSQISTDGKNFTYFEDEEYTVQTGEVTGTYEEIGRITNDKLLREYKFIDGSPTQKETANQKAMGTYLGGTLDFFEAIRTYVLVNTESTGTALTNGDTYYYKVVPEVNNTTVRGDSSEVVATASLPELEQKTEYLYDQIKKTKNGYYKVSASIYNKDSGLFSDSVNDITVVIDGATTKATDIYPEKGLIVLPNAPQTSLVVTYWAKKEQKTTRASVISYNIGPYTFTEDFNTLGVRVGKGATITETYGGEAITRTQWVTFTRFKDGETSVTMSAEDVASVIRSQTAGIKVFVDHKNRLILEDDQDPDIYRGSQIVIESGNKIVGFMSETELANNSFNYQGLDTSDTRHTTSIAGPIAGVPPDWKAIRISDLFPEVNDMVRYLNNTFSQLVKGLDGATNSLVQFIDLLQSKIDALSEMLKEAQDLLKKMTEGLTIQGGIYVLTIPASSGGVDYFKNALRTSIGYPTDAEYAGGIVLLYTDGATGTALEWITSSLS